MRRGTYANVDDVRKKKKGKGREGGGVYIQIYSKISPTCQGPSNAMIGCGQIFGGVGFMPCSPRWLADLCIS